jgi:hypothetical protein
VTCTHESLASGRLHLSGDEMLVLLVCDRCSVILVRYPSIAYTTKPLGLGHASPVA